MIVLTGQVALGTVLDSCPFVLDMACRERPGTFELSWSVSACEMCPIHVYFAVPMKYSRYWHSKLEPGQPQRFYEDTVGTKGLASSFS